MPTPNKLSVDRRDFVSPNGDVLPTKFPPAQNQRQGAKSFKIYHLNMKVKKQVLRANVKAIIDFVVAMLKKAEKSPNKTHSISLHWRISK